MGQRTLRRANRMTCELQLTKSKQIDLSLAVLDIVREPGKALTAKQIADICGCSAVAIHDIEKKAINKLRQAFTHRHDINDYLMDA